MKWQRKKGLRLFRGIQAVYHARQRVRSKRKPTKNYRIKSAKIQYLKKVDTNCVHLF